jgi:uncharacterized membrane protein
MAQLKPLFALMLTMLIWGVTPVFLRSLSVGLGPADALVIRYVPVALICIVILIVTGKWRIASADWPRLLVISIIGIFGYSAGSAYGFAIVPAGIGGLAAALHRASCRHHARRETDASCHCGLRPGLRRHGSPDVG